VSHQFTAATYARHVHHQEQSAESLTTLIYTRFGHCLSH